MTSQAKEIHAFLNQQIKNSSILIFDLDGTIIDSDYANFLAYKESIYIIENISLDYFKFSKCRFTKNEIIKAIPKCKNIKKIIELKNSVFVKYLDNIIINEAIVKIIKTYHSTSKIVLSTKSNKKRAEYILRYYKLFYFFDYRFYKEDITKSNNKFSYILNTLKVRPSSLIVFENEDSEIIDAEKIGISDVNIFKIDFLTNG